MNASVQTSDLAAGFAAHAAGWASARGAPADAVEIVKAAAARVGEAAGQGSVCIALSSLGDFQGRPVTELRRALLASRIVSTPDSAEVLPLVIEIAAPCCEPASARGDGKPGARAAAP